ncbi:metal ABC transporter ATP-binding protein [Clostridium niameyense]|uniref:Metal ABC transporter ATP-binding protein n=1 Tax=Clostridium niameyense TaxID=1622073 RepID=A0A6M0R879_9CLOT|nr:metal ABC transporter ATP-binding protein [Clostridium niameyense]NEZ46451.1 metal ABC transporter ATP-binding protein [Clostridium niameyense]
MIVINNLYFSYNKRSPYILENINLKINKGDYISILGQNGSGKSTLIKLILGFLKPLEGDITLNTNNIGYVPQKFDNFNGDFPITVEEVLNCHRKVLKLKDKSLINKSLEKVNMLPYKNNLIGNLSGGQRQKIFIARALMGNPKLLILDEPSTGIDLNSQKEIYKLINHLNITQHLTILSIEHNISAAYYNSTHIFKMENGKGNLYLKEDYIKNNKEVI